MTSQPALRPDLFEGPHAAAAHQLLRHCLVLHHDPEAETFARAVTLLEAFDRAARLLLVVQPIDRLTRDAYLCSYALQLAELAQRSPQSPRDGHAR